MTCTNREDRIIEIRAELGMCDVAISRADRDIKDKQEKVRLAKTEKTFIRRRKAKYESELNRLLRFKK